MRILFTFIILCSSSPLLAQQNALVVVTKNDANLREAKLLLEEYRKLKPKHYTYDYARYQIILNHIGPLGFEEGSLIEKAEQSLLPDKEKRIKLNEQSRKLFAQKLRDFNPNNFSGVDKSAINEAKNAVEQLRNFAETLNFQQVRNLLESYNTNGYGAWRSLKSGMVHLGPEIFRFAAAIAVVRIATCFGPNMNLASVMTMSAPSHLRAKNSDPACVEEIAAMLTDPVFYAGFTAFIAGSRLSSGFLNGRLAKWDPANGPMRARLQTHWVPNLSLAFGFLSDHLVKTLLHHKDITQCALSLFQLKKTSQSHSEIVDKHIERNGIRDRNLENKQKIYGYLGIDALKVITLENEIELYDIYGKNTTCRRAGHFLASDQFLKEELGMGIAGLLTTAITLSAATNLTKSGVNATANAVANQKLVKKALDSGKNLKDAKLLKTLTSNKAFLLLTATGTVGFAIQFGRLVGFLGLYEILNPYFYKTYNLASLEPNLESKTDQYINAYIKQSNKKLKLTPNIKCAETYDSNTQEGTGPFCTRIPLLAEAKTFTEYSANWRSKKILGEFHLSYGRWRQKLTSFINNFFSAKDQAQSLTRSREVYLTGKSEFLNNYIENEHQKVLSLLTEAYGSDVADPYFERIKEETSLYYDSWDGETYNYDTLYRHLDTSDIRYRAFATFMELKDIQDDLYTHIDGDLLYNLGGKESSLSRDESIKLFDQTTNDILEFIDDEAVEVNHPNHPLWIHNFSIDEQITKHLENLKPELNLVSLPFVLSNIKALLLSNNDQYKALGISLFRDWMPYMYGFKPRRNGPEAAGYNPRGMTTSQFKLYNKLWPLIKDYLPIYPNEWLYLKNSMNDISMREKQSEDTQRKKVVARIDTKLQGDYSLVKLLCASPMGSPDSRWNKLKDWWYEDGGLAMRFPYPKMLAESPCPYILTPSFDGDSRQTSATRTVFTTDYGLSIGLHSAYIMAPQNRDYSLHFSNEESLSQWWNDVIKPESLNRLKKMKVFYAEQVKDSFIPTLSQKNIEDDWFTGTLRTLFRNGSNQRKPIKMDTAVNSLNLSLKNQLYHYSMALKHIMPSTNYQKLAPSLISLDQCIDNLLNSISEKNYRVVESQCEAPLIDVKVQLSYQNEKYDDNALDALKVIDERVLAAQENGEELIYDRFVLEMSNYIDGIFNEISMYNDLVNESFNFSLEEK